jgi:hypothetical protein
MEGQMLQSIKKGTPGAEQVTVSFWVKSSNTGTYIAEMRDNDNSRACSRSYTINVANTWEKETITFPADTTGQLHNDNERSLELAFWFGAGSEYAGGTLQTTWGASAGADNTRAAGQLNLANRAGNYIAFTGIQWEVGPVATPFEFEDIGTTLRKCQRYYSLVDTAAGAPNSSTGIQLAVVFPVEMRAIPTATATSLRCSNLIDTDFTTTSPAPYFQNSSIRGGRLQTDGWSGLTTLRPMILQSSGTNSGQIRLNSEL